MVATDELSPEAEAKLAEYKISFTEFFASIDNLTRLVGEPNGKVADLEKRLKAMEATIAVN